MDILSKISLKTAFAIFSVACLISLLASSCPYTNPLYQPLLLVSMGIGALLLVWQFIVDRSIYRHPYFLILFLFCVSYGVTILLNRQSGFFTNCGQLVYTAFYFFLCFCGFSRFSAEDRADVLRLLCRIVLVCSLVAAVISLGMMLANYSAEVSFRGSTILIGFHSRNNGMQLTGITGGPSTLSELCLAGLASAWYLLYLPRRKLTPCCAAAAVIYLLTLCAANVYAALIMMLAFAVLFAFCRSFCGCVPSALGKRIVKAAVQAALLCGLIVCCFYGVQKLESAAVNSISNAVYQHELQDADAQQPSNPGTDIPGTDISGTDIPGTDIPAPPQAVHIDRNLATSANGVRLSIWKEGIKLFLSHPLGVTNNNISVKVFYGVPDYEYTNLHNGYLTLLVSAGMIGFAIVIVFGAVLFARTVKYLLACRDAKTCQMLSVLVALCGAILAGDLVNGCFVLWRGLQYIFLWLLLGSICAIITEPARQE